MSAVTCILTPLFSQAYRETHEEVWLEYAVSCFLQGIKFGIPNSRSHLPRVLYLLSFDTTKSKGKKFCTYNCSKEFGARLFILQSGARSGITLSVLCKREGMSDRDGHTARLHNKDT